MLEIKINANSTEGDVNQMQSYFGGEISERWGEYVLEFDNDIGKGLIKCLTLDWGVSLMEFDAVFYKDLIFFNESTAFNPIHFSYVSEGQFNHRFSNEEEYHIVEQYHAAILVSSKDLSHITVFPKNQHFKINNIRVVRQEYLKKRNVIVEQLNEKLHEIFIDDKNEMAFSHYSPIHLKMEEYVKALRDSVHSGMTRIMNIEGVVYHLLSMHIEQHDSAQNMEVVPCQLLKSELKTIKNIGEQIIKDPAVNYSLEHLSRLSGLSQAKLQEGFKFLYMRTVTEYIRFIRLEAARDLIMTTELNISQVVYTIGFTSRSYFSKIFKEKYSLTPNEFKKLIVNRVDIAI
jgi:AraC-like DNA-binding protein